MYAIPTPTPNMIPYVTSNSQKETFIAKKERATPALIVQLPISVLRRGPILLANQPPKNMAHPCPIAAHEKTHEMVAE